MCSEEDRLIVDSVWSLGSYFDRIGVSMENYNETADTNRDLDIANAQLANEQADDKAKAVFLGEPQPVDVEGNVIAPPVAVNASSCADAVIAVRKRIENRMARLVDAVTFEEIVAILAPTIAALDVVIASLKAAGDPALLP